MPFGVDDMLIVAAVSALAKAGGDAMSANAQDKDRKRQLRMNEQIHQDELSESEKNRREAEKNRELAASQFNYQAAQAAPMNTLNLISGITDLKAKREKSGSYLDTIRALSRG